MDMAVPGCAGGRGNPPTHHQCVEEARTRGFAAPALAWCAFIVDVLSTDSVRSGTGVVKTVVVAGLTVDSQIGLTEPLRLGRALGG
jgi:hypothetical protein